MALHCAQEVHRDVALHHHGLGLPAPREDRLKEFLGSPQLFDAQQRLHHGRGQHRRRLNGVAIQHKASEPRQGLHIHDITDHLRDVVLLRPDLFYLT